MQQIHENWTTCLKSQKSVKLRSFLPQAKILHAIKSLREQTNKQKHTLVISGKKKFKNEIGAYLQLLWIIKQALQKTIMHKTGPRLIKCLQENKQTTKKRKKTWPILMAWKKSKLKAKSQSPMMGTRSWKRKVTSMRKLLSFKETYSLNWYIYFHCQGGD